MPDNESLTGLGRSPSENGKAKSIPFLGAAHEGRKLGVEARGGLKERRVADALVNRQFRTGNHLCRVLGGNQVRVLAPAPCVTSTGS